MYICTVSADINGVLVSQPISVSGNQKTTSTFTILSPQVNFGSGYPSTLVSKNYPRNVQSHKQVVHSYHNLLSVVTDVKRGRLVLEIY